MTRFSGAGQSCSALTAVHGLFYLGWVCVARRGVEAPSPPPLPPPFDCMPSNLGTLMRKQWSWTEDVVKLLGFSGRSGWKRLFSLTYAPQSGPGRPLHSRTSAAPLFIRKFGQFQSNGATRYRSAAVGEGWTIARFLPPTESVFKMLSERYVAAIKTSSLCT